MTCANINEIEILRCFLLGGRLIVSEVFHRSLKNDLREGNQLAEDEPAVDHLDIGGGGQALHLADEDGGHHQHGGQVHAQGCLKEEGLEEGGGKGDHCEEKGRKVSGHHLACDLSFHHNFHSYTILAVPKCCFFQTPFDIGK